MSDREVLAAPNRARSSTKTLVNSKAGDADGRERLAEASQADPPVAARRDHGRGELPLGLGGVKVAVDLPHQTSQVFHISVGLFSMGGRHRPCRWTEPVPQRVGVRLVQPHAVPPEVRGDDDASGRHELQRGEVLALAAARR